ncbi:hypothetical protein ACMA1I_02650 [Pontibacter sp. 13R65]|uniref:hypothetical protein n=1 Tax=Pontibacter sp. 13R65 TaxID=3127458 RepID=UPI00301C6AB9
MGKKRAIAEVLNADLDEALSDKLYQLVYNFLKVNDYNIYFNIMQFKFNTVLDYPIDADMEYKIMHYMIEKMQEHHPGVLGQFLVQLQNDAASLTTP